MIKDRLRQGCLGRVLVFWGWFFLGFACLMKRVSMKACPKPKTHHVPFQR